MTKGHWSDCAVHNAPALPVGACDCGGLDLSDYTGHSFVAPFIADPGCFGVLSQDCNPDRFIKAQQLPANGLVADAAAANLPDTDDGVVFPREPASVSLNDTDIAVVSDLKSPLCLDRGSRSLHVHDEPSD